MDRLIDAINAKQNPSVVGLDPKPELVPAPIVRDLFDEVYEAVESQDVLPTLMASAYFAYNRAIIDAISDIVPAVKPQIAMYEALGPAGIDTYTMTCEYASSKGLIVIGDAKRGDIGSTAAAYASHLSGLPDMSVYIDGAQAGVLDQHVRLLIQDTSQSDQWFEDMLTVNPYLGSDGILPFVQAAQSHDKSIFVLVRTSNPSSSELQEIKDEHGKPIYQHVAQLVEAWGSETIGVHGYSRVGAVVGATHPQEGILLRSMMPHTFFLVPGYGAQGAQGADVAGMFDKQGCGAIVNSSRGIIGAWRADCDAHKLQSSTMDDALAFVADSARQAALDMRDELRMYVYR